MLQLEVWDLVFQIEVVGQIRPVDLEFDTFALKQTSFEAIQQQNR